MNNEVSMLCLIFAVALLYMGHS